MKGIRCKMKIGILTLFHGNNNWGGNLQGYALKKVLEEIYPKAKVDIIYYRSDKNIIYRNKIEQMMQYSLVDILRKARERVIRIPSPVASKLRERTRLFSEFQNNYLTNRRIYTDEDLTELGKEYDCLICGSDQIWNPNVAHPGYFLDGVVDCRKIAYAASIARDTLSPKEFGVMLPRINDFDYISVREKTAQSILEGRVSKNIEVVLDPTLLLEIADWNQLTGESDIDEKYAVDFFFSDNSLHEHVICSICGGMKIKKIPHAAKYLLSDELGESEKIYDVGPIEFLKVFKGASYIFTDSFHGAIFSLVFNKEFFVFERDIKSKVSKNSRLHDLLELFGLEDRMVQNTKEIHSLEKQKIDWDKVNEKKKLHRSKSLAFLQESIQGTEETSLLPVNNVGGLKQHECCGCSFCKTICPKQCISMKQNKEGFFYPIVDETKCISCGFCMDNCIQRKPHSVSLEASQTYIGYNSDSEIRAHSSSGGIFHAIASQFVFAGGIVYGAAFDEKSMVKHIRVDSIRQLERLMKSKYVQSSIENIIADVAVDLKGGKKVLFSGTPCQVAAIIRLAEKNKTDATLYTLDFICHGVPSPGVWSSYIDYAANGNTPMAISFRDKNPRGWHDYYFSMKFNGKVILRESHEMNAYMRSFLTNKNIRASCYDCRYKGSAHIADITLGDAWKIEKEFPQWADDKGTSVFVVRSEKGRYLLSALPTNVIYRESSYERWSAYNESLEKRTLKPEGRKKFFDDYSSLDCKAFWIHYSTIPRKKKIRYYAKRVARYMGIEKLLRS